MGGDQAHAPGGAALDPRDPPPQRPASRNDPPALSLRIDRRATVARRAPSKLDPFKEEIECLLRSNPRIPNTRIRELIAELGYQGGKSILDDHLREVRPRFAPKRTYQRTVYRPAEICQFDLWEPKAKIPVGHDQVRRAWVVTCELGFSRAGAGALIFSKQAPDILWGMGRCLIGAGRPARDRGLGPRGGNRPPGAGPARPSLAFCGALAVGWSICEAR